MAHRCYVAPMDSRSVARIQALGRVAIGGALIAAPAAVGAAWMGAPSRSPATRVALTAVGARDLAIGLGTALALGGGESARGWLIAGTLADAIDLAATLKFREDLPRGGAVGVGLLAGGSAALGVRLITALD